MFRDDLAISLKFGGFLGELTKCALVIGWARRQGGADWLVLENESLKSIRGIEIFEVQS